MQPVISLVVKGISGGGVRRAGRGYVNENFQFRSTLISIMSLGLMAFYQEIISLEKKMKRM